MRTLLVLTLWMGSGFLPGSFAPIPSARAEECLECHEDTTAKLFKHEAAVTDCGFCHAPHGTRTAQPHRLLKPVNTLCLDCHDREALRLDGGHVVARHPTYLPRDPMFERGGATQPREFNCVSCHQPHSSEVPALFRYDYRKAPYAGSPCDVCHWGYAFPGSAPFPPANPQ